LFHFFFVLVKFFSFFSLVTKKKSGEQFRQKFANNSASCLHTVVKTGGGGDHWLPASEPLVTLQDIPENVEVVSTTDNGITKITLIADGGADAPEKTLDTVQIPTDASGISQTQITVSVVQDDSGSYVLQHHETVMPNTHLLFSSTGSEQQLAQLPPSWAPARGSSSHPCKASPAHVLLAGHALTLAAIQGAAKGHLRGFKEDAVANAEAVTPLGALVLRQHVLNNEVARGDAEGHDGEMQECTRAFLAERAALRKCVPGAPEPDSETSAEEAAESLLSTWMKLGEFRDESDWYDIDQLGDEAIFDALTAGDEGVWILDLHGCRCVKGPREGALFDPHTLG